MILSVNAELRIFREVDLDIFRSYEFATLTASNPFVALPGSTPTTMAFVRYASIYQTTGATANERIRLLQKDVSYMNEYWPNRTSTGQPNIMQCGIKTQFTLRQPPILLIT